MKKFLLVLLLLPMTIQLSAQTWEEWTRQKKTQIKYLRKQIVALQVYIEFAKKSYDIAKDGLTLIGNIKDGEFSLHKDFFAALKLINPKIANSKKIADIIAIQVRIVKNARVTISNMHATAQFTSAEIGYCQRVFNNLLEECFQNLEKLLLVITACDLEMKDDERIKEIEKIYLDMQEKLSFSASYSEETTVLSLQRKGEQIEINRSKIINGLP